MRGQVKVYQKKIIAKRRRRTFFVLLCTLGALVLSVSGFSFVSQLDSLSIEKIITEGSTRLSETSVRDIVLEKIRGNYGFLFAKRSTFLYPKNEIETELTSLPSIRRVDVSRRGLNALVVFITEREESARWCSNNDGSSCYLLDDAGMVFAPAQVGCGSSVCISNMSSSTSFVYKGIIAENPLGKQFLPEDQFKKIEFFVQEIEGLSLHPIEASINQTGYMTITLFDGGQIIINSKDNLTKVLANLETLVADKKITSDLSRFLRDLDYIKIDSGNKVVYKMKTSTTTTN